MAGTSMLMGVHFELSVGGAASEWQVVRAHVTESLSAPYECAVEVAAQGALEPADLLGQPVALAMTRIDRPRRVCGVVASVTDRGYVARRRVAEVVVVPSLWLLSLRSDYRIFQDVNALEAVEAVLREADLYQRGGAYQARLKRGDLATREYCTQYGETDLDFVRRLLEEEGLTFHFEHGAEGEALVITDAATGEDFEPLELDAEGPVPVMGQGGDTLDRESVHGLDRTTAVSPQGVRLRDYDFTHPARIPDEARGDASHAAAGHALYEYPARFTLGPFAGREYGPNDARRVAPVRLAEARGPAARIRGRSNLVGLRPGVTFEVLREDATAPEEYLVVSVTHTGEAPEVLYLDAIGFESPAPDERYVNAFECVPADAAWRPPRVTPRPRATAPQSAVVAPAEPGSADAIGTDVYGRVRVRFQWDRPPERVRSQRSKPDSCWLRVSQPWAGEGWGFVFIPRVGMEVLVQFLDGDPDRPVVTGCLYKATHMPPEALPQKKTRSILRTRSVDDPAGYNELSFEDLAGSEEVFLRAQKDLVEKVLHDHRAEYDHDETVTVGNDQTLTVKRDRKTAVQRDDALAVTRKRTATVGDDDTLEVEKNRSVTVFKDSSLTVSGKHVMSIDESLKAQVGGGAGTVLEMLPDSIKLSHAQCSVEITATAITVKAGPSVVKVDAASGVSLQANSVTASSLSGSKLDLQPGTATVESPGLTTVKGSLVKIN